MDGRGWGLGFNLHFKLNSSFILNPSQNNKNCLCVHMPTDSILHCKILPNYINTNLIVMFAYYTKHLFWRAEKHLFFEALFILNEICNMHDAQTDWKLHLISCFLALFRAAILKIFYCDFWLLDFQLQKMPQKSQSLEFKSDSRLKPWAECRCLW